MMLIRHSLLTICSSFLILVGYSQDIKITSPNKQLQVIISVTDDKPAYSVTYKDKVMLENSPLGLKTNEEDFTTALKFISKQDSTIDKNYEQSRIKKMQSIAIVNISGHFHFSCT